MLPSCNKTIHQLRNTTIPYFRKKRVPLTTRQISPVLIEPLSRTSLMAPNFHPLTNPKEEFCLFFCFALNFGENFRVLKVHRAVAAMVEVLCDGFFPFSCLASFWSLRFPLLPLPLQLVFPLFILSLCVHSHTWMMASQCKPKIRISLWNKWCVFSKIYVLLLSYYYTCNDSQTIDRTC